MPLIPLALSLGSAVLYGLAFPPTAFRLLAWVALAPLLVTLRRARSLRGALLLAWAWTVAAAYTVGDWLPGAVSGYYAQSALIGAGFFLGVSTFMAAIYYMGFAACYRRFARAPAVARPLLAAAAWVAAELGRVELFTGNPWALAGYSQVGLAPVVQIADLAGVYGVTFTLLAVNAGLAEVWLAPSGQRRTALAGLGLAGAAAGLVLAYGGARLTFPPEDRPEGRPVTVAIVQGNLDLGSQWRPELYGRNLDVYLRLTHEVLAAHPAELVLWPESAMTFFLDREPLYRTAIASVITPRGAQLLTGGPRAVGDEQARYFNSAFLLSPEGAILGHYDKQHLLPFAEYFPLPQLDFLRRQFGRVREFTPGEPTPLLPTVAGDAGVLVCNEVMFPGIASARVRAGADYLVNLSNDSWIGDVKFAAMAFDMAALRAVEQRRYLVRASTSGPSGVADRLGRARVVSAPATRAAIAGQVEAGGPRTLYNRAGDLFALGCALVVAVAVLVFGRSVRP